MSNKSIEGSPLPDERWRSIPGLPAYSASSLGRIRADVSKWPSMNGRILVQSWCGRRQGKNSYMKVSPHGKTRTVHSLVALAFYGIPPAGHEVNHRNGIKTDNRVENLEYLTHAQNLQHSVAVLGHHRGAKNGFAKLSEPQVLAIRSATGPQREIAARFGIAQTNVSLIRLRKAWAHLKETA